MLALEANIDANVEIRYTHCIRLTSQENIFDAYRENIRREIRKAKKVVRIEEATTAHELIELNSQTFARQGQSSPLDRKIFTQIFMEAKRRGRGKILLARLSSGEAVAGAFVVWDKIKTYYLVGGSATEYRNSGSMSFVLHQAILDAHGQSIAFDFEGSMIPNIARFFRAFAATSNLLPGRNTRKQIYIGCKKNCVVFYDDSSVFATYCIKGTQSTHYIYQSSTYFEII